MSDSMIERFGHKYACNRCGNPTDSACSACTIHFCKSCFGMHRCEGKPKRIDVLGRKAKDA